MATTIVPFRSISGQATFRRALLQGAADLGAVVALGVPAALAGEPADAHPAWYAEWKAAIDYMDGPAGWEVEKVSDLPIYHRALELENLIGTTPARTLAGAAAQLKVLVYCRSQGLVPDDALDAGLESALAVVERLAREAAHA